MLRKHDPNRYWDPYVAGVLLGLLLFLTFFLTGHGLGSSGGVNRILVAIEDLVVPRHVDTTPYLATMAGGERNPLDHWIVWQVVGILIGGFVSGWLFLGFVFAGGYLVAWFLRRLWEPGGNR